MLSIAWPAVQYCFNDTKSFSSIRPAVFSAYLNPSNICVRFSALSFAMIALFRSKSRSSITSTPSSIPKGTKAIFDKLSLPFKISISKIEKMLFEDTKIRKIN